MITYELAKELKDAGFKSSELVTPAWYGEGFDYTLDDLVPNPTLSELIEACVKISRDQDFHLETIYGDGWRAATCFTHGKDEWEKGPTPEEAVARLWLALNKK